MSTFEKQELRAKRVTDIQGVFHLEIAFMEEKNFATAWSLTAYLATDGKKYAAWLDELSAGEQPIRALEKAYGKSAEDLFKAWRRYAMRKR